MLENDFLYQNNVFGLGLSFAAFSFVSIKSKRNYECEKIQLLLIKRIVKLSSRFIILFGNFNLIISTKEKKYESRNFEVEISHIVFHFCACVCISSLLVCKIL